MPDLWFNQDYYISQKVEQMNATHYVGRTGTAETVWTPELAEAERAAWNVSWLQNFNDCNRDGYVSTIPVTAINVAPNELFNVGEYAQEVANYYNTNTFQGRSDWTANQVVNYLLTSEHTSLWDHYTNTGAALGLNPSNAFSTQAWADAQAASTGQTAEAILASLKGAGQNPLMSYFDGGGTIEGATDYAVAEPVEPPADFDVWAVVTVPAPGDTGSGDTGGGDTGGGDQPAVPVDTVYTEEVFLTPGPTPDNLTGQNGVNTAFLAYEFDGVNTLQSGDIITGGTDAFNILVADVTAGSTFGEILNTVRPAVRNVQTIKLISEQSVDDYTDDHQANAEFRADRVEGMRVLYNMESQASLVTRDVRTFSNQMTVGWQNADNANDAAQNMDNTVLFNNQYLKADDASTSSVLNLELMDVRGAVEDDLPFLENAVKSVTFWYDNGSGGRLVTLNFGDYVDLHGEASYQTFLDGVRAAIEAQGLQNELVAELDGDFIATANYDPSKSATGRIIQVTAVSGTISDTEPGCGWGYDDVVSPLSDPYTNMQSTVQQDCPLLRTDVDLDNVGMVQWDNLSTCIPNNQQFGDFAGDMVVGGQGDGNWVGLQRFDVTVDRGSWLSTLESTNNALRMITADNGVVDHYGIRDYGVSSSDGGKGNLFIGDGQRLTNMAIRGGSLMFEGDHIPVDNHPDELRLVRRYGMLQQALYEGTYVNGQGEIEQAVPAAPRAPQPVTDPTGQTSDSGVLDVAVFDAHNMVGDINIAATVTDLTFRKYLGDTDQVDSLGNKFAPQPAFDYQFGSGNDTLNMHMNAQVAADNDFTMTIDMGEGNNSVHTEFDNTHGYSAVDVNNPRPWLIDQWQNNNVSIRSGSGNDIINPWGDGRTQISTGAGNDVVYSDNSGIAYRLAEGTTEGANEGAQIEGLGAIWVLNQTKSGATLESDLTLGIRDGDIVPLGNDFTSNPNIAFMVAASVAGGAQATLYATVEYMGVENTAALQPFSIEQIGGSTYFTFSVADVNKLLERTVNGSESWLSSLLSAQETAGRTMIFASKVDGVQATPKIGFSLLQGPNHTELLAPDLSNIQNQPLWNTATNNSILFTDIYGSARTDPNLANLPATYRGEDLLDDSAFTYATAQEVEYKDGQWVLAASGAEPESLMPREGEDTTDGDTAGGDTAGGDTAGGDTGAGDDTTTPTKPGYEPGTLDITGTNSVAYADNKIELGQDTDLAVLSTSANAHETIVIGAYDNGHDTILNFSFSDKPAETGGADYLDLTSIFGGGYKHPRLDDQVICTGGGNNSADGDAGLKSGTAGHYQESIVYVKNDTDIHIYDANSMLASINANMANNPHYHTALFMVYQEGNAQAAFDMYLANYDASGTATVTDLGMIKFANFFNGAIPTDSADGENGISAFFALGDDVIKALGTTELPGFGDHSDYDVFHQA